VDSPCIIVRTVRPGSADRPQMPNWFGQGLCVFGHLYYGLSGAGQYLLPGRGPSGLVWRTVRVCYLNVVRALVLHVARCRTVRPRLVDYLDLVFVIALTYFKREN
jgi:hypothetical protein